MEEDLHRKSSRNILSRELETGRELICGHIVGLMGGAF